ncbi:MAG: hypothetical protein QXF05_05600 [Thermofilaceae archaeon]
MLSALASVSILWLVLFGIGRLDAREGVPNCGDLYRWLITPLVLMLLLTALNAGAYLVSIMDVLAGRVNPGTLLWERAIPAMLANPEVLAVAALSVAAPLLAYDLGYASVSGVKPLRLPGVRVLRAARAGAARAREPARRVEGRARRIRSVTVDGSGRLVVRLE